MASKHKSATEVTIASTQEETALHRFVRSYWKTGVLVAVAITAGILFRVWSSQKTQASDDASWDRLRQDVSFGSGFFGAINTPDGSTLSIAAEALKDEKAGPWAKVLEVSRHVEDGDFDGARSALGQLENQWSDHPLVTAAYRFEEGGEVQTIVTHLRERMSALEAWEGKNAHLFQNPPLPEGSPRVRVETSAGNIVLGLDQERAPRHAENFLKHCREGFYDGTLFHRVISGFMIQGGDPNTRDGEPDTWGLGGTDYKLDPEFSELSHFPMVLAAAKSPGDTQSNGSQFFITTGAAHHLDGQHTVYGKVLEGESIVRQIESGAVVGDRPQDPVEILSTTVLP